MGTFNNVTVGTGSLKINDVDVGFLKGSPRYSFKKQQLDFEAADPAAGGAALFLQGRQTIKLQGTFTFPFAELKMSSISIAIGGDAVTTIDGTEVTIAFGGSPGDSEAHTFGADPLGGPLRTIQLATIAPSGTGHIGDHIQAVTALVVKDATEVTTFTVSDDYILDANTGKIFRNPSGAIGASTTVHVAYHYTPPASQRIKLGADFNLDDVKVEFIHTRPQTGKIFRIVLFRANASGEFDFTFNETAWNIYNVVFETLPDFVNNPTAPFGYIEQVT